MSSSKLDTSGVFGSVTLDSQSTAATADNSCITLPLQSVHIRKNGIEFLTSKPISAWTEMTVDIQSPRTGKPIRANGVVIACTGTVQTGYVVGMVFLNLTRQAQQRLVSLSYARLS